jgi:hypothetical protein
VHVRTLSLLAASANLAALLVAPAVAEAQSAAHLIASHGFLIERTETYVDGVRVVDAERVLRRNPQGRIDWEHTHPLALQAAEHAVQEAHAHWALTESAARRIALGARRLRVDEQERVLLEDALGIHAAWRIALRDTGVAEDVFVLVPSLTIARVMPRTSDVLGDVYARNPLSDGGRTTRITMAPQASPEALTNASFNVRSCDVQRDGTCLAVQRAMPDARGDFLLTPNASAFDDGFAEVNAFHHLNEVAARFEREHAFRYVCPLGGPLEVRVNFTLESQVPLVNAAFVAGSSRSCASFVFGQAATFDFAYDADVLHHEFAHLVTAETSGLVAFGFDAQGAHFEPLALSEGTSDYWAAVMQGDGVIGESVREIGLLDPALAIREIDAVYTCPESLGGSGHLDGRVWSSAMWALRQELGPKVDALMYLTVASLSRAATFAEAAEAAITTAQSLVGREGFTEADAARVEALMRERGLVGCRRVVPLRQGASHALYSGLSGATGANGARLGPVQIALATPQQPERIVFTWRPLSSHGRYVLHMRRGAPVETDGRGIVSDEQVALTAQAVSFARLGACETAYFAIETLDLVEGATFVELTVSALEGGALCEADAGTLDAGSALPSAARGGGCVVGSRANSAPMFTFLVFLVWRIRRRSTRGI